MEHDELDQNKTKEEKQIFINREKERKKQLALEKKSHRASAGGTPLLAQERFAKSDSALPAKETKEEALPLRNALSAGGGMKELGGQRDMLGDEFSSVINNPVSREYFRRFLIRNSTEEHLRFLFEIRKYNSQKDSEERFDVLYTIVNKFVKFGSKDMVNLSSTVRTDILNKWKEIEENGNEELLGDELLAEAYYYVYILLRDDCYPKFTNSSECAEMKRLDAEGNPTGPAPTSQTPPAKAKPDAPQPVLVSSTPPLATGSKSGSSLEALAKENQKTETHEKKKRSFWPFRKEGKS